MTSEFTRSESGQNPQDEDRISACMSLVGRIQSLVQQSSLPGNRDGILAFALDDLAAKVVPLAADFRRHFISHAISSIAAGSVGPALASAIARVKQLEGFISATSVSPQEGRTRPQADVVIVTVISVERTAALKAFGIDLESAERSGAFVDVRGRKCFAAQIPLGERVRGKRNLKIYITMVGEPRNVPCANVCRDLMEEIDVDLFLLVGIGGGNRALQINQGDVIGASSVFYIEGGKKKKVPRVRLAPAVAGNRFMRKISQWFGSSEVTDPETLTTNLIPPAKQFYLQFAPKRSRLKKRFKEVVSLYGTDDLLPGNNELKDDFEYHQGHVMCGEKVIVDDSMAEQSEQINRKLACVDMESYGFSASCAHREKPWLVFRGISDFADPKKDDAKHVSASIAAAVTARFFLAEQYVEREARNVDRL